MVSSTLTDPQWENTTIIDRDPLEAVRELKAAPGQDVVVAGSIQLAHALITAGREDVSHTRICVLLTHV